MFQDGTEVEVFQFGANYEDELGEFAEEMGDEPSTPTKADEWDTVVTKDGEDFQFRSKLGTYGENDVCKGLEFVDLRFKALEISISRDFPPKAEQELFGFVTPATAPS